MDSLDRLGWAAAVVGRSHGVRIAVRVSTPDAMALVRPLLPAGWKESADEVVDRVYSLIVGGPDPRTPTLKRFHVAYADFVKVGRQLELEPVLDALGSDLALFVAQGARRHVFLRAGVVGWKGKALLITGQASTGKSTLVAALVRAGAEYYSDTFAVLDARGRVHPYPGVLSLRDVEGRRVRHAASALGAVGTRPLPVGLVVSSSYKPGARWRPRTLTRGQAAMELLANAIPARGKPREVLSVLAQALAQAQALKGTRGEADVLAPRLLGLW